MPDWTYQTILRPVLKCFPPVTSRKIALESLGYLAQLPGGRKIIQLMGHMKPDSRLPVEKEGIIFPTPVGLSAEFDPEMTGTAGFTQFGFGFLEIGPRGNPVQESGSILVDHQQGTITLPAQRTAFSLEQAVERLQKSAPFQQPRLEPGSSQDIVRACEKLKRLVQALIVPARFLESVLNTLIHNQSEEIPLPVLVRLTESDWHDTSLQSKCLNALNQGQVSGFVVSDSFSEAENVVLGKSGKTVCLSLIQELRISAGESCLLIGSVGVHTPADALDYLQAGADLVQVDSGLVFSGPGLSKRINEANLYRKNHIEKQKYQRQFDWEMRLGFGLY